MIIIVNKKEKLYQGEPFKVHIGRPSVLGNPYSTKSSKFGSVIMRMTTKQCIEDFREFFRMAMISAVPSKEAKAMQQEVHKLAAIHDKYGKLVLECWCAKGEITTKDKPYVCHGQVIAEYLEKYLIQKL